MSKRDPEFYKQFGTGFNPNAVRKGGVVVAIGPESPDVETPLEKLASEETERLLQIVVDARKNGIPMTVCKKYKKPKKRVDK
jgi:hypothetical protein